MKYANEAITPPNMHTGLQPNLLVSAETMGPEGEKIVEHSDDKDTNYYLKSKLNVLVHSEKLHNIE